MIENASIDWNTVAFVLLFLFGISLGLSALLLGWVIWRVRRIQLPPDADFVVALRATPLAVVILLDLLDFGLDFMSAPFSWTLLTYLGLTPLRGITVVESLIPGTQVLPLMTLGWFAVRLFKLGRLPRQAEPFFRQ